MLKLTDYEYPLPDDRIAQCPALKRDHSQLMILTKSDIKHRKFFQITEEIQKNDVIVVNNSKVIASNLPGKKESGGKIIALFLREIDHDKNIWECLLKGKKIRIGNKISFLNTQLIGTIIKWEKFGKFLVQFSSASPIQNLLEAHASIKLPPYIKKSQNDLSRYQTIYSSKNGSLAAPTAGFHFTKDLIRKIEKKGAKFVEITLHVGYSTFMRLDEEILSKKKMDPEFFSISDASASIIQECLDQNTRLIVVGTTTLKALESAASPKGKISQFQGWSDLFIAPNYTFKLNISHMLTNFHLPKSAPLLMVCAFAGKDRILNAYQDAIKNNYRFYSFGDAMFCDYF